ncbi:hypothetical protein EDB81DRAFT_913894 [Dactylonectria macrodidyma]|uniref:Uncharacterized protein n=1 Tax=Dactylonectria macrodidyma TaxID=307937 RepID=A0A9P9DLD6_9HYPO|nr:hypothetical protein EDB81DRAFT_913894 [Dactylonectria macrodidyma]
MIGPKLVDSVNSSQVNHSQTEITPPHATKLTASLSIIHRHRHPSSTITITMSNNPTLSSLGLVGPPLGALVRESEAADLEVEARWQVARELHEAGETHVPHDIFAWKAHQRLWKLGFQHCPRPPVWPWPSPPTVDPREGTSALYRSLRALIIAGTAPKVSEPSIRDLRADLDAAMRRLIAEQNAGTEGSGDFDNARLCGLSKDDRHVMKEHKAVEDAVAEIPPQEKEKQRNLSPLMLVPIKKRMLLSPGRIGYAHRPQP